MRDPKRIDRILNKLRIMWSKNPDLRLGQLITNLSGRPVGFLRGVILHPDLYQIKDTEWENNLDRELKNED